MAEKKRFVEELADLIERGQLLGYALRRDCFQEDFETQVGKDLKEEDVERFLKSLPDFSNDYQPWYSEALSVVKQVLPDRLKDFESYFEYPRVRKDITFQNYMIRDCVQGLRITRPPYDEVVVDKSAAIPEFNQQLQIVKAAKSVLESSLMDMEAVLQADLFDSEVDSARALATAGFLRAAGAICGVVIEKHLVHVCGTHEIKIKKKNPGINDLNQQLRDTDVISMPQWRFIQHLADIRNLCDHAKGKEPTKDEIGDLTSGTDKVTKTVF